MIQLKKYTTLLSLIIFALHSRSTWSQFDPQATYGTPLPAIVDDRRWYQIEVIIFAQGNRQQAFGDESWNPDIRLEYPTDWVTLKDPATLLSQLKAAAATAEQDAFLDTAQPPSSSSDEPVENIDNTVDDEEASPDRDYPLFDEATTRAARLAAVEHLQTVDYTREPFYLLPEEMRELNAQAQQLRRSRQFRLLFHGAWRQPLVSPDDAPAVIISAGDTFGDHRELEGSIAVGVSRYLHLKTDLWLTRFTDNYGQERIWPEIPRSPDQQKIHTAVLNDYGMTISQPTFSNADRGMLSVNEADSLFGTQGLSAIADLSTQELAIEPLLGSGYSQILSQRYLPERITVLRQKRRMRSEEIHYIDHPLMGIIIVCRPHELETAEPTDAEAANTDMINGSL